MGLGLWGPGVLGPGGLRDWWMVFKGMVIRGLGLEAWGPGGLGAWGPGVLWSLARGAWRPGGLLASAFWCWWTVVSKGLVIRGLGLDC